MQFIKLFISFGEGIALFIGRTYRTHNKYKFSGLKPPIFQAKVKKYCKLLQNNGDALDIDFIMC